MIDLLLHSGARSKRGDGFCADDQTTLASDDFGCREVRSDALLVLDYDLFVDSSQQFNNFHRGGRGCFETKREEVKCFVVMVGGTTTTTTTTTATASAVHAVQLLSNIIRASMYGSE
eukprot:GEZU01024491.1.p1 GENE.GEZU01024491.1~~GEZU01024491.1.p1  ORF type:complete len:117 (+),score=14.50 GEZU01024491.1:364-714(+)